MKLWRRQRLQAPDAQELSLEERRERLSRIRKSLEVRHADRHASGCFIMFAFIIAALLFLDGSDMKNNVLLGGLVGAAILGYSLLGWAARRAVHAAISTGEPAAVGCIVRAVRRGYLPAHATDPASLYGLVCRVERMEWEMMSRDEVHAVLSLADDSRGGWAGGVGIAAARSAALHGELRALQPLRTALAALASRHEWPTQYMTELRGLMEDLEAQAVTRRTTDKLLRPADACPELLRVPSGAGNLDALVRPVEPEGD